MKAVLKDDLLQFVLFFVIMLVLCVLCLLVGNWSVGVPKYSNMTEDVAGIQFGIEAQACKDRGGTYSGRCVLDGRVIYPQIHSASYRQPIENWVRYPAGLGLVVSMLGLVISTWGGVCSFWEIIKVGSRLLSGLLFGFEY